MKCWRLKMFLPRPSIFQVMEQKVVEETEVSPRSDCEAGGVGASTTGVDLSVHGSLNGEKRSGAQEFLE